MTEAKNQKADKSKTHTQYQNIPQTKVEKTKNSGIE